MKSNNKKIKVAISALGISSAEQAELLQKGLMERDQSGRTHAVDARGHKRSRRGMIKPGHITNARADLDILHFLLGCKRQRRPPPVALINLIAYRLTGKVNVDEACLHLIPRKMLLIADQNPKYLDAAEYNLSHPGASDREIARAIGVDHKTVARWRRRHGGWPTGES